MLLRVNAQLGVELADLLKFLDLCVALEGMRWKVRETKQGGRAGACARDKDKDERLQDNYRGGKEGV